MPPAGSGELISRKLRSPSHSALSNHPFHPYPPPDLLTPHPHTMNQTACSYEWEFVLPISNNNVSFYHQQPEYFSWRGHVH